MLTRCHHHGSRADTPIYIFLTAFCLSGCSILRQREKVVVRTETVAEYRDSTVWRDTTVFIPIPLESNQAIVHVGDTSHRETSVAESDAWVGSDGFLHHTMSNKQGKLPYQVSFPERYLVSSVTNTKDEARIITREVKVEKKLNLWQRFRIGAFWWLLGLVLFAYRKQILAAIMKAFGHY